MAPGEERDDEQDGQREHRAAAEGAGGSAAALHRAARLDEELGRHGAHQPGFTLSPIPRTFHESLVMYGTKPWPTIAA